MALSAEETRELTARCHYAQSHGFEIANAEQYAVELGYAGETPPLGVKKFSPAHLLLLLQSPPREDPLSKFKRVGRAVKKAQAFAARPPA